MKKYIPQIKDILTLKGRSIATIAALLTLSASIANGQATVGGVEYDANTYLTFSNRADFLAGNVDRSYAYVDYIAVDGFVGQASRTVGHDYQYFNLLTGDLGENGSTPLGTAEWAAGNIANWNYDQVSKGYDLTLANDVTVGGVNYAANTHLSFLNTADFLAGDAASHFPYVEHVVLDGYVGQASRTVGHDYQYFNLITGDLGENGSTPLGTAEWAAGTLSNWAYDQASGGYEVTIAAAPATPTPTIYAFMLLASALFLKSKCKKCEKCE